MLKLKKQYRDSFFLIPEENRFIYYPYMHNYLFKIFSVMNEKRVYYFHKRIYTEYPIKIRASRGRALPDPYDDVLYIHF